MRKLVLTGGRRNKNAAILSSLIIGATIVISRKTTVKGPVKSWTLGGQLFVAEGW
jgi:hypothetical protein